MEEGKDEPVKQPENPQPEPQKQSFWSRLFGKGTKRTPQKSVEPERVAQEPERTKVDSSKTSWDSEQQSPEFEAVTNKVLRSLDESPPDSPEDGITPFWQSTSFFDIPDSNLGQPKASRAFDANGTYHVIQRDMQNADGVKTGVWEKYGLLKQEQIDHTLESTVSKVHYKVAEALYKRLAVVLESVHEDNGNAREIAAVFDNNGRVKAVYEILGSNNKATRYTRAEIAYTPEGTISDISYKNEDPSGYIPGYAARVNLQPAPKQ